VYLLCIAVKKHYLDSFSF